MKLWMTGAVLYLFTASFSQVQSGKIEFDVVSIKPAEPFQRRMMSLNNTMLRYENVSLKDCIREACRMRDYQVEGPDWLATLRFSITAKLPEGSSRKQTPEMLQAMLEDRFKLKCHRVTRECAVYALSVAKRGPQLKPVDSNSNGGMRVQVLEDRIQVDTIGDLGTVSDIISKYSDRPIVDMTGLSSWYELSLVFARPVPAGSDPALLVDVTGSIRDALERYGLTLQPRKAPIEFLVVDSIEKSPTENW